eukprot:5441155-Amphidinium_carterae.1
MRERGGLPELPQTEGKLEWKHRRPPYTLRNGSLERLQRVMSDWGGGFEASLFSSMEARHIAERLSVAEHDVSAATRAYDPPCSAGDGWSPRM